MEVESQECLSSQDLAINCERDWGGVVMLGSPQGLLKQEHISVGSRHKEKVIRHISLAPAICLLRQAPHFIGMTMS